MGRDELEMAVKSYGYRIDGIVELAHMHLNDGHYDLLADDAYALAKLDGARGEAQYMLELMDIEEAADGD